MIALGTGMSVRGVWLYKESRAFGLSLVLSAISEFRAF
jgi:hypothetical protein